MPLDVSDNEGMELYENGKHRRYNLLFAVNGGTFAVARLFLDEPGRAQAVLGGLSLLHLSLGMAAFTVVMVADIFMFGTNMAAAINRDGGPAVFGKQGRIVLVLLGALIVLGWLMVGFGGRPPAG